MPKLYLGFITFGKTTAKYLPYFLKSLTEQTFKDFKVLVVDNSSRYDNENVGLVKKYFPYAKIDKPGVNLGFAKAYNRMIRLAVENKGKYFLVINPDMILEKDAVYEMVSAMESKGLDSISPKILQWDFKNLKKTEIIDSCGIKLMPGLRFVDIGQGHIDCERLGQVEILGPSGAAGMYKIKTLEKVAYNKSGEKEYFDELMFLYKEDCDLAYRMYLEGCASQCLSQAVIYHDRTAHGRGQSNMAVALNSSSKSRQVKKWSFLNQQIILAKYWNKQSLTNKLAIVWIELKMIVFAVFFEQYLLGQLWNLFKIRKQIRKYNW